MKILMLNYEFPPIGGGGGFISKEIATGLANHGHQITVITSWFKNLLEEETTGNNLKIYRLKVLRKKSYQSNPIEMADWIQKTKKFTKDLLLNQSFDLCFANFVMPGGEVALYLKRKFNLPFVVISHGHDIPWVNARKQWPLYLAAYSRIKRVLKTATLIFVQSIEMEKNLLKFYQNAKQKVVKIPNGYSKSIQFKPQLKDQFIIVAAGRLVGQKNPETYIKGFLEFNKKHPESKLIIFGDGPKRNALQKLVKKHQKELEVEFRGKTDQKDVLETFSQASVFVTSSLNEGMSLAIFEAAASGLAIISTKVSGANEIVGAENGVFVDFKSPQQISNQLTNYYQLWSQNQPLIDSEKTLSKISNFSWDKIVETYHQHLLSLKL